ncbi:unnamed protein product [Durusdinium trenchii]|uniref:Amino acid transporter transmembrane domain-containing protein n=2 Tax=Durusdinium trenchii TaxID=1381693 RepID=A0ABP0RYR7_9DINO
MPAVEGGEEGAEEEHEEGLLTGHGGAGIAPQPAPEAQEFLGSRHPQEAEAPRYTGGDMETLSELSEAPTENISRCAGESQPRPSRWQPGMALFYPLLRLGQRQSRCEATFNLLNNLLGAGLLAMPRAMADAGLISGLALMGILALANRYTMLQVLWMSHSVLSSEECSYPELGRHVFGQKGLAAVLAAYLLLTLGILSSYLMVIVDLLNLTLPAPRAVQVCLAVLICLPGASLRSLKQVALVSVVCMLGVCCLVVVLTTVSVSDVLSEDLVNAPIETPGRPGDVDLFRGDIGRFFSGAALFSLQFSVQAGGIEVLSRLDSEQQEAQEAPASMSSLLAAESITEVAYTIALLLSATLGTAAYLRFGDRVAGNVLLDFSPTTSYWPLMASWVSYAFVVVCSFAFIMVPCRLAALDVFALRRRDSGAPQDTLPKERFFSLTAGILGICALVAWICTDLSEVLKFVGVWATMALAFILPCSFLIELRRRQEGVSWISSANWLELLLIAFGVSVAVISTVDWLTPHLAAPAQGALGQRTFVPDLREVNPGPGLAKTVDPHI